MLKLLLQDIQGTGGTRVARSFREANAMLHKWRISRTGGGPRRLMLTITLDGRERVYQGALDLRGVALDQPLDLQHQVLQSLAGVSSPVSSVVLAHNDAPRAVASRVATLR